MNESIRTKLERLNNIETKTWLGIVAVDTAVGGASGAFMELVTRNPYFAVSVGCVSYAVQYVRDIKRQLEP